MHKYQRHLSKTLGSKYQIEQDSKEEGKEGKDDKKSPKKVNKKSPIKRQSTISSFSGQFNLGGAGSGGGTSEAAKQRLKNNASYATLIQDMINTNNSLRKALPANLKGEKAEIKSKNSNTPAAMGK